MLKIASLFVIPLNKQIDHAPGDKPHLGSIWLGHCSQVGLRADFVKPMTSDASQGHDMVLQQDGNSKLRSLAGAMCMAGARLAPQR